MYTTLFRFTFKTLFLALLNYAQHLVGQQNTLKLALVTGQNVETFKKFKTFTSCTLHQCSWQAERIPPHRALSPRLRK